MGRIVFILMVGLILVGAVNNIGWGEGHPACYGAETWLRIRSAFPTDQTSVEGRREELRQTAWGGPVYPVNAQMGIVRGQEIRTGFNPRDFSPRETAPLQRLSGTTQ